MKKIYLVLTLICLCGYCSIAQVAGSLQFSASRPSVGAALLDPTVGINDYNQSSVSIYAYQKDVYIDLSAIAIKQGTIEIYNITGSKVVSQTIENKSINKISLSNCVVGCYIVKLVENGNITTQKVFVR